jgi:hypothetical protein
VSYVVVAFFTINTPYEDLVKRLVDDCLRFNLEIVTKGYPSRGKWERNAGIKPEFLLEMLQKHPDKDIVYLDADARIRRAPEVFSTLSRDTCDIAVHYRRGRELLSGTIFLANTVATRRLVSDWVKLQKAEPDTWDQRTLQRVIKARGDDIRVHQLSPNYTQIFDSMRKHGPPVIEHMQASRRYKNLVKGTKVSYVDLKEIPVAVRLNKDGSVWIPRQNKRAEAYLDSHFVRDGRQLRWFPKIENANDVSALKDKYVGKTCTIIGKGPSLDNLISYDFTGSADPVICINHSVKKVERVVPETTVNKGNVYLMQQDIVDCKPQNAIPILHYSIQYYYPKLQTRYLFNSNSLEPKGNSVTVLKAVSLAALMGCTKVRLVSFDACVNGDTRYAKATGTTVKKTSQGGPERFLTHRKRIVSLARYFKLTLEWFTPNHRAEEAAGKSQQ